VPQRVRRAPLAFWVAAAAAAWSLALIPAAFLIPVYRGTAAATGDGLVATSSTLVAQNGLAVLVPVCVPAMLTLLIWFALHRGCARGGRIASLAASGGVALLAAFNVLALLSIGVFVLPATLLVAWAASLTRPDGIACASS
jgi:hypothetical protein